MALLVDDGGALAAFLEAMLPRALAQFDEACEASFMAAQDDADFLAVRREVCRPPGMVSLAEAHTLAGDVYVCGFFFPADISFLILLLAILGAAGCVVVCWRGGGRAAAAPPTPLR